MSWLNKVLSLISISFGIFVLVIGFFMYEEHVDIHRYSKYGIVLNKDDHHQSLGNRRTDTTPNELSKLLGHKASMIFAYLDRDGNGLLSATEMEPLIHLLRQNSSHHINNPSPSCNIKNCLRVSVAVGHIDFSRALYVNFQNSYVSVTDRACSQNDKACLKHFTSLTHVLTPVKDTSRLIAHRHFLSLLPRSKEFLIGRVFYIVDSLPESDERFLGSRGLFFDNYVEMHERALAVIVGHLKDSHVNLYPSTEPRYSMGIVRAKNSDFVEIIVRLMVDFDGPKESDFLVMASAFVGRLVLRLTDFQVVDFHLHQESEAVVVTLTEPPLNVVTKLSSWEMKSVNSQVRTSDISWTEAISPAQAVNILREEMYGLKGLNFLSLSELAEKLEGTTSVDRRPILLMVFIGNIFDQTCRWGCPEMRLAMQNPKVGVKIRYEFTLASTTHFEMKEISRTDNLSLTIKNLNRSIQPFLKSALSFIVLSSDGKRVVGHTSASELNNKTRELLEPLQKMTDIEQEAEDELKESNLSMEAPPRPPNSMKEHFAQELVREKKIKELSASSLLEFLDDTLSELSRS